MPTKTKAVIPPLIVLTFLLFQYLLFSQAILTKHAIIQQILSKTISLNS